MSDQTIMLSLVIVASALLIIIVLVLISILLIRELGRRSANSVLELYVSSRADHANGPVAEVYAKVLNGDVLNPTDEARRRLAFQHQLNLYDLLYMHHRKGFIDQNIWQGISYRIQKVVADNWSKVQWDDGIRNSVSMELRLLIESDSSSEDA